ncbi:hypothetical protein V2154_15615 [Ewingella sp. CoE-038-23]|uniref:hypothetical protein n=1 Tax=Ewingella docleensis TaxID=3118588 RepID=UPI003365692B
MIAPQPKSGELIDLLSPSLIKGENLLSEFEIRRIVSESRKLPDRYQGLSIEGLAKIVSGDLEEGYELLERALKLAPFDVVSWGNYARSVGNKNLHSKQLEVLRRALVVRDPILISDTIVVAAFWLDLELLDKVVAMAQAMEIQLSEAATHALKTYERLHEYGDEISAANEVAKLVMEIAERHDLPAYKSLVDDDGDGLLGFSFVVKTEDPKFLADLNNELIDEMIKHGLESSNCIGYFEPDDE